jgi:hypothetical protein
MPIKEVCSPINSSRGGGPGSNPPLGPGSRTNPSRGDQTNEPQPSHTRVSLGESGSEVTVTGPQEKHDERPQERQSPEE